VRRALTVNGVSADADAQAGQITPQFRRHLLQCFPRASEQDMIALSIRDEQIVHGSTEGARILP
jgi:hypothetical protein